MKRKAIIILSAILGIFIIIYGVGWIIIKNIFTEEELIKIAKQRISPLIKREINIEHARLKLSFFKVYLSIKEIKVKNKKGFKGNFFTAERVDIGLALLPLLSKKIDFKNINIIKPEIKIYKKGESDNFSDLFPKEEKRKNSEIEVILSDLSIKDGKLDIEIEENIFKVYGINEKISFKKGVLTLKGKLKGETEFLKNKTIASLSHDISYDTTGKLRIKNLYLHKPIRIKLRGRIKNLKSKPYIDIIGIKIEKESIEKIINELQNQKLVKLPSNLKIGGNLNAQVDIKGKPPSFNFSGGLYIKNGNISYLNKKVCKEIYSEVKLEKKGISHFSFHGRLGKGYVEATGRLPNFFSPSYWVRIKLNTDLKTIDFLKNYSSGPFKLSAKISGKNKDIKFSGKTEFGRGIIKIPGWKKIKNIKLKGEFSQKAFKIKDLKFNIKNSDFSLSGMFKNFDELSLSLCSNKIIIDEFLENKKKGKKGGGRITIPLLISLDFNIKNLYYEGEKFSGVKGRVVFKKEKIEIKELISKLFGGEIKVDYAKINLANNSYQSSFSISSVDITRIEKRLSGRGYAEIFLSGKGFSKEDIKRITSYGNVTIRNFKSRGWEFFSKLALFLGIKEIKNMNIPVLKGYYRIKNGWVSLPDILFFTGVGKWKVSGGFHLDGRITFTIDYTPAKRYLEKVYRKFPLIKNAGINTVPIIVTGSFKNPKFRIDRERITGKIKKEIKRKIEKKRKEIKREIKKKIKEKIRKKWKEWRKRIGR